MDRLFVEGIKTNENQKFYTSLFWFLGCDYA